MIILIGQVIPVFHWPVSTRIVVHHIPLPTKCITLYSWAMAITKCTVLYVARQIEWQWRSLLTRSISTPQCATAARIKAINVQRIMLSQEWSVDDYWVGMSDISYRQWKVGWKLSRRKAYFFCNLRRTVNFFLWADSYDTCSWNDDLNFWFLILIES